MKISRSQQFNPFIMAKSSMAKKPAPNTKRMLPSFEDEEAETESTSSTPTILPKQDPKSSQHSVNIHHPLSISLPPIIQSRFARLGKCCSNLTGRCWKQFNLPLI